MNSSVSAIPEIIAHIAKRCWSSRDMGELTKPKSTKFWSGWKANRRDVRSTIGSLGPSGVKKTESALAAVPVSRSHGSPRIASMPAGSGATKKDRCGREIIPDEKDEVKKRARRT